MSDVRLTVKSLPAKPHTAVWLCACGEKHMRTITRVGQTLEHWPYKPPAKNEVDLVFYP
jgi:hypothetical protein